jgi:hypothetical protein
LIARTFHLNGISPPIMKGLFNPGHFGLGMGFIF